MPKRPLLIFPSPQLADRTKRNGRQFGLVHKPNVIKQGARLSPLFAELQNAFDDRRVEIKQNAIGTDPEKVLVIEVVGGVENFSNAVKRINGLEWMGEFECGDIEPDEDFYDEKDPEKKLTGHLYLVMTNHQAIKEMLSLWRRYQDDPGMKFERGFTKFRDVFHCLKNIRPWGVQDRLLETGILSAWKEDLSYYGDRVVRFEAELWFRRSESLREISADQVTELVQQAGGRILGQSVIEDIAYHGLLAELPANAVREIVENPATELVRCEGVMFFRPVGQMVTEDKSQEKYREVVQIVESPMPSGDPVIALFDGLPLANHSLLAGRLSIDDPDGWEVDYATSERKHGSAMASLIVNGDLNLHQSPLSRPVYVRPIMKPRNGFQSPRQEGVPEDCLAVDLIHRAVRRLFDGDQNEGPVAPKIKVINLSIGDKSRQFTQTMSPLARLLDWLSEKYGVLFIVSAGNQTAPITLDVSREEFNILKPNELEEKTIKALYRDIRNRKLLSPAETINGITVGALHNDNATVPYRGDRIDPFVHSLPSPISSFGSGYRRAIKPDILFDGGRQWYRQCPQKTKSVSIAPVISRIAPGNKVASPGTKVGDLCSVSYCCGTSNATALISRVAGIYYDSLQQLIKAQSAEVPPMCEAPLLKAMLVHGCSWGDIALQISKALQISTNSYRIREQVSKWIGYGIPKPNRVLSCTEQRATILGFGNLSNGEAHVFSLPLPPSLGSRPEWRRLTVTLAWLSPVLPATQKYRAASLWFEIRGSRLVPNRTNADWQAVQRGTVQHEIFEGQSAEPLEDGEVLEIKVNCREDAGKIHKPIPYGLVVSLEIAEGIDIDVYNEVRTRIKPKIQIQQETNLQ